MSHWHFWCAELCAFVLPGDAVARGRGHELGGCHFCVCGCGGGGEIIGSAPGGCISRLCLWLSGSSVDNVIFMCFIKSIYARGNQISLVQSDPVVSRQ